ncbi:MAG TPA: DUF1330 domain-containing protein [Ignavibacteriaceae bacterium]|nr:DUF1330 domain-containing protein [Ignavibacteriaceae bacterium]
MSSYMIVEIDVKDPVGYEDYKKQTPASLKPYGGKFIVRGGNPQLIEGETEPTRIVILQFENSEKAKAWWNSPEYEGPKKLRQTTAKTRMILVEGT